MCLAFPVQITDITAGPMPMGHVAHGDTIVSCCFAYVPEAQVGDYVLMQSGFAVEVLDPDAVAQSFDAFADLVDQGLSSPFTLSCS
ncbi:MAG: HypC/HybG/HupF family hydrogenase formation chaperone [Propionibacteriaceae bacterium]|nr:HypC/HybG/HupF family hydrogenase formation chaperone [Propionibacteriaceae bacterium]